MKVEGKREVLVRAHMELGLENHDGKKIPLMETTVKKKQKQK